MQLQDEALQATQPLREIPELLARAVQAELQGVRKEIPGFPEHREILELLPLSPVPKGILELKATQAYKALPDLRVIQGAKEIPDPVAGLQGLKGIPAVKGIQASERQVQLVPLDPKVIQEKATLV